MTGSVIDIEYRDMDAEIKSTMKRSANDAVRLGHLLRGMMEKRLWASAYDCFEEYLGTELHMDYTMASRFIGISKKYSVGDGGEIGEKWAGYSQAVLIEMLNMPAELEGKVTPDMTVRQVREIKRQARREKKQARTVPEPAAEDTAVPVEDALPTAQEVWIPEYMPASAEEGGRGQEALEKVATSQLPELVKPDKDQSQYLDDFAKKFISDNHEWMMADFSNRVMDVTKSPGEIRGHLGKNVRTWHFKSRKGTTAHINLFDDYVQLWDGAGAHMGDFEWFHLAAAIQRMWNVVALEKIGNPEEKNMPGEEDEGGGLLEETDDRTGESPETFDEFAEIKCILAKERRTLDEFLAVGGLPAKLVFRQKTVVAALAAMVCDLEDADNDSGLQEEAAVQPALPILKNNDQRKQWLGAYKDWGLWYHDENIGTEYYKYDFGNGARLIAEVYHEGATKYHDAYESCFLHLVGGPEPPKGQHGIGKWTRHEKYSRYPNSETELVEFLKEVQRNG